MFSEILNISKYTSKFSKYLEKSYFCFKSKLILGPLGQDFPQRTKCTSYMEIKKLLKRHGCKD